MSRNDARLRRARRVASRSLDGQAVLVLAATGEVLVLNETATLVWTLLETPRTRAELARGVAEAFEVDEDTAEADVEAFLTLLIEKGAVAEADPSPDAGGPGREGTS